MITFPDAKINLGLNIVERRADGYHNLETVFYPIALTDVLEIVPARGAESTLTTYGNAVDCPAESNLVMKALRLLQREHGCGQVHIHLYKHIPHGAGLGGGSSDAAFTLAMLNEMFSLGLGKPQLAQIAATLGADCPFFIHNAPMMATGIGDLLTTCEVSLEGYWLVLVKPAVHIPTAVAYAHVTPTPSGQNLPQELSKPVAQWQETVKNDFEPSVFAAHPHLAAIKRQLLENGALYAAMSGSGSSIFGIYGSDKMAENAASTFADTEHYVIKL